MGALLVQPVSMLRLHCYAHEEYFRPETVGHVNLLPGIQEAHLVTAGRSPERWCLVVVPELPLVQSNAETLAALMRSVGQKLGLGSVCLLRPLSRQDAGPAVDIHDWLKL